jgi:hypothetical protein
MAWAEHADSQAGLIYKQNWIYLTKNPTGEEVTTTSIILQRVCTHV